MLMSVRCRFTVFGSQGPSASEFYQIELDRTTKLHRWYFSVDRTTRLSARESRELMLTVLRHACGPGVMGSMSTAAAPNDPIFWPIHPTFDRLWHYIRLHPDHAQFDHTWPDDPSCAGRSAGDSLPFRGLFEDVAENSARFYTNRDLYALFDPRNPKLPYVYADFESQHCEDPSNAAVR